MAAFEDRRRDRPTLATADILYVGDDFCRRIPVMASAGLRVCQTKASIPSIRNAIAHGDSFSAISFHSDFSGLARLSLFEKLVQKWLLPKKFQP